MCEISIISSKPFSWVDNQNLDGFDTQGTNMYGIRVVEPYLDFGYSYGIEYNFS